MNNIPEILSTQDDTVDNTATIIVMMLLFLTLLLIILIAILLIACKERALFIFREIDLIAITGGKRKKVVGGILIVFFVLYIGVIWIGYLSNYVLFNERRESSETDNPFQKKDLPSSFEIELNVYLSKVKESKAPFLIFNATAGEKPDANPDDLCRKYKHTISDSTYFKSANYSDAQCERTRLNEFTDVYKLKMVYKEIEAQQIKDQFISIRFETDFTQAVHFFEWKFKAVWDYGYMDYATAYSELSGIMTPQDVKNSNKNITSAFKGPQPTVLNLNLIPTHYVNEVEGVVHNGYRVHFADFQRGSIVNKRTLVNEFLSTGEKFEGFSMFFVMNNNQEYFQVRIQKIKSILEVIAYMLGFLSGFILIVRGIKYYLLKETYFLELEKNCEKLFGRHNEMKYEEDDDVTNIELMRLQRTRYRNASQGISREEDIRDDSKLTQRNDTMQLDNSELNEDDESDLKNLQI